MSQPQPRRWTASTVIVFIVLFFLAEHFVFNVALPTAIKLAVGALLGVGAIAGVLLAITLIYCLWLVVTHKPRTVTKE